MKKLDLCSNCNCMTKTINGKCGKCNFKKKKLQYLCKAPDEWRDSEFSSFIELKKRFGEV